MNKLVSTVDDKLLLNPSNGKLLCVALPDPVWPFNINSAHILMKVGRAEYVYHSQYNNPWDEEHFDKGKTLEENFTLVGARTLLDPGLTFNKYQENSQKNPLTVDTHSIVFIQTSFGDRAELTPIDSQTGKIIWNGEEEEQIFTIEQDPYVGAYMWGDGETYDQYFIKLNGNDVLRRNDTDYPLTPDVREGEYTFTSGGQTCRLIINSLDQVSILAGMSEIPLVRYN